MSSVRHTGPAPMRNTAVSILVALVASAGVFAPMGLGSAAYAQNQPVKAVEPYCVAAKAEGVPLKSGPALVYYQVAALKKDQVLRVDGVTDDRFLRVEYPKGMKAFVKVEDATVEEEGKTIRLPKPATIWAVNISGGERANWRFLLEDYGPANSKFPVLETLKTPDGKVYGFLIPAPADARGYVKEESTRRATPEESDSFQKLAGGPAATPAKPAAEGEKPIAAVPTTDANKPADATAPPAPEAAKPVAAAPEAAKPAERRIGNVEALQSLYQDAQSGRNPELGSVIAEFERAIQSSRNAGDTRTADFLIARQDVLKLRQQVQESMSSATTKSREVLEDEKKLGQTLAELEKTRNYVMVGRLVASTVYDGKRLPLMYRVQGLETGFARTVGYLMPNSTMELDGKLGRVIGVVGESRFDETLRLSIVTPKRVDILTAREIPGNRTNPIPATPDQSQQKTDPVATGTEGNHE